MFSEKEKKLFFREKANYFKFTSTPTASIPNMQRDSIMDGVECVIKSWRVKMFFGLFEKKATKRAFWRNISRKAHKRASKEV